MGSVYEYNKARTCPKCLAMDTRGVSREFILNRNTGKIKKDDIKLRRNRKKSW